MPPAAPCTHPVISIRPPSPPPRRLLSTKLHDEADREAFVKKLETLKSAKYKSTKTIDDFEIGQTLGEGAFGRVVLAQDIEGNEDEYWAIKIQDKKELVDCEEVEHVNSEKNLLYIQWRRHRFDPCTFRRSPPTNAVFTVPRRVALVTLLCADWRVHVGCVVSEFGPAS